MTIFDEEIELDIKENMTSYLRRNRRGNSPAGKIEAGSSDVAYSESLSTQFANIVIKVQTNTRPTGEDRGEGEVKRN